MICSGAYGHFIEVTYDKEVVWEYVNPSTVEGIKTVIDDQNRSYNSVFRVYRHGTDFQGLAGKDLTPMGTITGRIPATIDELVGARSGTFRWHSF